MRARHDEIYLTARGDLTHLYLVFLNFNISQFHFSLALEHCSFAYVLFLNYIPLTYRTVPYIHRGTISTCDRRFILRYHVISPITWLPPSRDLLSATTSSRDRGEGPNASQTWEHPNTERITKEYSFGSFSNTIKTYQNWKIIKKTLKRNREQQKIWNGHLMNLLGKL